MEIVERRSQSAGALFVVIATILATLLIGLAALALRPAAPAVHPPTSRPTASSLSPDAQDRNVQILAARLGKAEATHGH